MRSNLSFYFSLCLVLLLQVLVFDTVFIGVELQPLFYFLPIMVMPVATPLLRSLVLSFFLGITVDVFLNTFGTHTFTLLIFWLIKTLAIQLVKIRSSHQEYPITTLSLGVGKFLTYATISTVCYVAIFALLWGGIGTGRSFQLFLYNVVFSWLLLILLHFLLFNFKQSSKDVRL